MNGAPTGAGGPRDTLTITDRELFDRLGWFTQVRWAFGGFCLLALLLSWHVFGLRLRLPDGAVTLAPPVEVVLALFLYNAAFAFLGRIVRARRQITRRLTEFIALAQILFDLAAIALLIHYTGGAVNFFVVLILVPIAIVTELLPQRLAYATAAVAAGLFNLLAWGEQRGLIPHVDVVEVGGQPVGAGMNLHADAFYVLHVTAAVTVTIFAMVLVASTIASRLRTREGELEQAHRRLAAADEAKGFLMRRVGHEMRAPLAAIGSILDAFSDVSTGLSDQQRMLLGRARARARSMIELVNDLLKFSRLRAPQEVLKVTRLSLAEVVTGTVELLRRQAEEAGLALSCRAESLHIVGDAELLGELVTNLLANAIQYTPRGGRIDVTLDRQGDQTVLTVTDTGIGISHAASQRLFEEFYRAPEAKDVFSGGTGLGLAIVRRIVEIHRGSIEVAANQPRGTVFRARLPLPRDT